MMYCSPINHTESELTGSTIETMIDKAKNSGLKYFSIVDHNSLSSALKGYSYCKKVGIKPIIGVELYFKDSNCQIIKGTPSENIKYFKIALHALNQKSYQELVKLISREDKDSINIGDSVHKLYTWDDLEHLSRFDILACTTDIEDMVSKHLLVNRPDMSLKYYQKLKLLFGDRLYLSIIPYKNDRYWDSLVKITLPNNNVIKISSNDRVEFCEKTSKGVWKEFKKATAQNLLRFQQNQKKLTSVFINKVKYKIKPEFQNIEALELSNCFQSFNKDLQLQANKLILMLAKRDGMMGNVLINDYSYYADKQDKIVQDMKLGESFRLSTEQHMRSQDEVIEYLKNEMGLDSFQIDKIISNSNKWTKLFDNFELKYNYSLIQPKQDPKTLLINQIKAMGRMKWDDKRYVKQLKEEMALLTNNGELNLIPYFLPIIDIYDFYRKNGYLTGPSRGSAGGFLISYLIGITHIDPIKYKLSSSRFITLDRIKSKNLPDIDCDLESRLPLVGIDGNGGYLKEKYGNKVAQISTRTLLRIKSAILDANRFVNGGELEESVQKLSKSLPNTPQGVSDKDYVFGYEKDDGSHVPGLLETNDDLQKYAVDRPKEWEIVKRALSISRQNSRHASAFIIADKPIEHIVPIMEIGGVKRVTQPEAKQCEQAGLIKYDFLVVSSLKDINLTLKLINKKNKEDMPTGYFTHKGEKTFIWSLPEDIEVYKDLWAGKTETVFQLNSVTVTPAIKKIKPKCIEDCAAITSLWRPGPLDFVDEKTGRNMAEEYIERRFGRSKGDIEILNKLLPETYGIIAYQEDLTFLAKELAGFNVTDAENVRIATAKKKTQLMASLKPKFIQGASKKVGEKTAIKIWDMIETFARYSFNKSHATAYVIISYACAFLKHYYPLEWWAAVLSNATNKEINEVFYKCVKDIVLPPDINASTENMTVDYKLNKIRNKLSVISGLGGKSVEKIVTNRPYKDIYDFVSKGVCGPSMTKKLIYIGVLDSLFENNLSIDQKMLEYEKAVQQFDYDKKIDDLKLKIKTETDKTKVEKLKNRLNTLMNKGPKEITMSGFYIGVSPKMDYMIKKTILPSMNLNLFDILLKDSKWPITTNNKGNRFIMDNKGREFMLIKGEMLQKIDQQILNRTVNFCCPAYVVDMSVFSYKNNTKKALKIILDSSGYVSEKVLWPDFDGNLHYPKNLNKGSIVYVFYNKRENSRYTNIYNILVEQEALSKTFFK